MEFLIQWLMKVKFRKIEADWYQLNIAEYFIRVQPSNFSVSHGTSASKINRTCTSVLAVTDLVIEVYEGYLKSSMNGYLDQLQLLRKS